LRAGYLVAAWLSGARDYDPLTRICSRVEYVNGLQEARAIQGIVEE
jgi:hypothetical protein